MGNSQHVALSAEATKKKRVVIVGFSIGGFMIANSLMDHVNVTVIEKNDYFESITVSIKAALDKALLDDVLTLNEKAVAVFNKINYKQA